MKVPSYLGDENSEKNENSCDSNSYRRNSCVVSHGQVNANSQDAGDSIFSTASSSSRTSVHWYSYDSYIFSRCIKFFIYAKQKHYNSLNKHVFSTLSNILLRHKQGAEDIENLIPQYEDNIPTYAYRYKDAVLHMRKDKQNLDEDISSFQVKLKEYNDSHIGFQSAIKSIIENKINAVEYKKEVHNQEFKDIEHWVYIYLDQIKGPKDIRKTAAEERYDNIKLHGYSETANNTIKVIMTKKQIAVQHI